MCHRASNHAPDCAAQPFRTAPLANLQRHQGTLSMALVVSLVTVANGATRLVSNMEDSGVGSLRRAIAGAAAGDTIRFSTNGVIALSSGELFVGKNLDIIGPGATNLAIRETRSVACLTSAQVRPA